MAVKTFEREVKKLSSEFTNLIENYNFEQYDFHSIRKTLQDYIERTYPNYNDYFRSDYIMMLIELFAFYGEMMAYRVDMNMNEAFLSTAKDRRNIIKIADMLGYKFNRIEPAVSMNRIDITDASGGSRLIAKKKQQGTLNDILSKSAEIVFEPMSQEGTNYFPYKLDYLFKTIKSEEFMNTLNNIFKKLENFSIEDGVKIKRVNDNNFEYYERSIFVDKFQMRVPANENVFVDYVGSRKMFEIQSLKFDEILYFNTDSTFDAITYNGETLYDGVVELGFEFVLSYDKGNNIIDKNVYMYVPIVQGGTFSREIEVKKGVKGFKDIVFEQNIFNNKTTIKQFDENGMLLRTYYEVESLANNNYRYAYEVNNTPEGFLEVLFGDGKNSEILLPAAKTIMYYRKNVNNSDEIFNVKNASATSFVFPLQYYDANVGQYQMTSVPFYLLGNVFNASGGLPAESNEQIKYMARKIRSVQDRFVTAKDYETAGLLHPRVKYSTVLLRTYIGKNSSRISNDFIDVYFDQRKNEVEKFELKDSISGDILEQYLIVPSAYFTESTVPNKYDTIRFIESGNEYYIEIFDADAKPANEWFKYPVNMIEKKTKGTVIRLTNKVVDESYSTVLSEKNKINNILTPFDFSISNIVFTGSTNHSLIFLVELSKKIPKNEVYEKFEKDKLKILDAYNMLIPQINFIDVNVVETNKGFSVSLYYMAKTLTYPAGDLSFVWTHYKADDIFINPSKSNIIEIYVSGVKHDLKRGIEVYEPLSSSEINKLISDIDKRKMISDYVHVYNSNVFEIETAIKVHKSTRFTITDELLKSKINVALDGFFDIKNIPLGKHFYMSRLIEWLHSHVQEIQHIEMLKHTDGEFKGETITPSSSLEVLGDRVTYTQIVEKQYIIGESLKPKRIIEIIS